MLIAKIAFGLLIAGALLLIVDCSVSLWMKYKQLKQERDHDAP